MIETVLIALTMGIAGSFHCIGMCGPLALALPLNDKNHFSKFTGTLLYNSGRIITYTVFGLAAGTLSAGFSFFGFQQLLSIAAGLLILLFVILPKLFPSTSTISNSSIVFFEKLRRCFSQLFFRKNNTSLFAIGILNGLLPCGLVYVAIASAATTGSITNGALFMAAFGAGTLPVMWSIAFWGQLININIRQRIRKMYPYMMMLMACFLILRGMGMGIPYISPKEEKANKINCCAKP